MINYLNDITTNMNNGSQLCVTDRDIPIIIGPQKHNFSVKEIFSFIIDNANFNSLNQQDASEALTLIFQVLKHQQTNENISTTPFGFCTYKFRYRYTCIRCQNEDYSDSLLGTILTVSIPQTENVYSQFDMKEAVMSTLEDTECERICPQCENYVTNQKLEIVDTRQFFILQLLLFDSEGQK